MVLFIKGQSVDAVGAGFGATERLVDGDEDEKDEGGAVVVGPTVVGGKLELDICLVKQISGATSKPSTYPELAPDGCPC